jgi:hypothetical protein
MAKKEMNSAAKKTPVSAKVKSWTEKVNDATKTHEVKVLHRDFSDMHVGDKMLIATPKMIDGYLRQIPKGKDVKLATLRKDLAMEIGADNTCPLTTGIFLRIAAEAAIEQINKGKPLNKVAPFWRVIDEKMPIAKKLSCGTGFVKIQRQKEHIA